MTFACYIAGVCELKERPLSRKLVKELLTMRLLELQTEVIVDEDIQEFRLHQISAVKASLARL